MLRQTAFQQTQVTKLAVKQCRVSARNSKLQRLVVRAEKSEVVESIREIIIDQLGITETEVTADSKFVDLGADSLDTVEIMMALEEKFDVALEDEGAEKITTVAEAADVICEKMATK